MLEDKFDQDLDERTEQRSNATGYSNTDCQKPLALAVNSFMEFLYFVSVFLYANVLLSILLHPSIQPGFEPIEPRLKFGFQKAYPV